MLSIKGSQTEKNLLIAFAGEGQARNRYTFYASKAKKEGLMQISSIFELTANQEKEHAERFFKFLEGGELEVCGLYPAGIIADTKGNLLESINGEHYENSVLYPEFEKVAEMEGFKEISGVFKSVIVAEKNHEQRYRDFYDLLENNRLFHREKNTLWQCRNCGYSFVGEKPPALCPSCAHEMGYFELMMHNW